jgi:hypothetical protein
MSVASAQGGIGGESVRVRHVSGEVMARVRQGYHGSPTRLCRAIAGLQTTGPPMFRDHCRQPDQVLRFELSRCLGERVLNSLGSPGRRSQDASASWRLAVPLGLASKDAPAIIRSHAPDAAQAPDPVPRRCDTFRPRINNAIILQALSMPSALPCLGTRRGSQGSHGTDFA